MIEAKVCPSLTTRRILTLALTSQPLTKEEVRKLIRTLNSALGDRGLCPQLLESTFEKWWPELEERVEAALNKSTPEERDIRADRELLEEAVVIGRTLLAVQTQGNSDSIVQKLRGEVQQLRTEFHAGIGRTIYMPVTAPVDEEEAASEVQRVVNEINYKFTLMTEHRELYPEVIGLIERAREIIFRASDTTPALKNSKRLVDYMNQLNGYVSKYHLVQKLLTPKTNGGDG